MNEEPQPPKQSTYTQPTNPVTRTPLEQTQRIPQHRTHGDAIPSITRHPASSTQSHQSQDLNADLEYGVEHQPSEGRIASAVQGRSRRAQSGAHSGPVGGARGPGAPTFGGEPDFAGDMGRKAEEHFRVLGESAGQTPGGEDGQDNQDIRERRGKDVVGEVAGGSVVG